MIKNNQYLKPFFKNVGSSKCLSWNNFLARVDMNHLLFPLYLNQLGVRCLCVRCWRTVAVRTQLTWLKEAKCVYIRVACSMAKRARLRCEYSAKATWSTYCVCVFLQDVPCPGQSRCCRPGGPVSQSGLWYRQSCGQRTRPGLPPARYWSISIVGKRLGR